MNDLDLAKKELGVNVNIAFAKDGKIIFSSSDDGIKGFISAIKEFGGKLNGSSVADRIAGRAVALLCIHSGVKSVFAEVMSDGCKNVFQKSGVAFQYGRLVNKILNKYKNDVCPLEKLVLKIEDPQVAFERLEEFLNPSV
jgi:hypothetical protein